MKVTQLCPTLCDPHGQYRPWNSPGQNTGVGSLSLLQGIFPTQGSNPGLLHRRRILDQLSHKESPRTEVGSLSLLQGIFPTQELNWCLLHCRQILSQLSYKGSPVTPLLPIYPSPTYPLVTISLFSVSVSLLLFCK